MLERKDWLLLFIGLPSGPYSLDQIRIMKGLFLFAQEIGEPERALYDFEPYAYGPFDVGIYRDLDALLERSLVSVEEATGTSRRIFSLTSQGEQQLAEVREQAPAGKLEELARIKRHVTSLGFSDLLKDVYDRYPDYAVRSVARL